MWERDVYKTYAEGGRIRGEAIEVTITSATITGYGNREWIEMLDAQIKRFRKRTNSEPFTGIVPFRLYRVK